MKYPIGVQDFEDLRRNGYVYVDKTKQMYEIATRGKYYFLGHPCRFGKSLLLSTLEAYFLGKKELFKGLAIERLEKDWTKNPVLRLDFYDGYHFCPDTDGVYNPFSLLNALDKRELGDYWFESIQPSSV